jgi:hypothetical protein
MLLRQHNRAPEVRAQRSAFLEHTAAAHPEANPLIASTDRVFDATDDAPAPALFAVNDLANCPRGGGIGDAWCWSRQQPGTLTSAG